MFIYLLCQKSISMTHILYLGTSNSYFIYNVYFINVCFKSEKQCSVKAIVGLLKLVIEGVVLNCEVKCRKTGFNITIITGVKERQV